MSNDWIYLSASQIKGMATCPRKQYYKRVLKWDEGSHFNFIIGSTNHSIGEESQRLKCLGLPPYKKSKAKERAVFWFNYHLAKYSEKGEIRLDANEKEFEWDDLLEKYIADCKEYAWIYVDQILPKMEPMRDEENGKPMIEYPFELNYIFNDGLKVKVIGFIDTIDIKEIVVDLKNVGKKPSTTEVRESDQYKIYAIWFKHKFGRFPTIRQDTIVKVKNPYYAPVDGFICEEDEVILKRRVHTFAQQKIRGVIHPSGMTYMCNERMCAFYPTKESVKKQQFCDHHYAKTNI